MTSHALPPLFALLSARHPGDAEQLYDTEADPHCMNNLAADQCKAR